MTLNDALKIELAYCRHADLSVSEVANRIEAMLTRQHDYWCAGEPDCPPEIKASNGELTRLLCRNCGDVNARSKFCLPESL